MIFYERSRFATCPWEQWNAYLHSYHKNRPVSAIQPESGGSYLTFV